jgi:propionate catabolism operon transcriptional regulator
VGLLQLRDVLQALAPEFAETAVVEVLEKGFDEAVADIRRRQQDHGVDVVVAAGSNGAHLRAHLDVPVVTIKVGGLDIMDALVRARQVSTGVALVLHGEMPAELSSFVATFALGVACRSYHHEAEARRCVLALKSEGIGVVAAPGLVCDLALEAGMQAVFLYSPRAVRDAFRDAIELARLSGIELAKRERLNTILDQLKDGVVAVDLNERIETLNPAMELLLGSPARQLLGQTLSHVAPELSLQPVLHSSRAVIDEIQRFGTRTLVTSRMPIVEQGVQTGAVLTCQDPATIQRVDRHLRSRHRMRDSVVRHQLSELIGDSAAMKRVRLLGRACADNDVTVLVTGDTGTGKELLAQGIHEASARRRQPFVAVNCAAFSETLLESELFGYEEGAFTGARRGGKVGLFEAAHTGTLFLDEIGDMPLHLQTRLLRVLQEREVLRIGATEPTPVDVRVIAATHCNLAQRIEAGEFRSDLYYRLNILRIDLPALRDRREDLPVLAHQLLWKTLQRRRLPAQPAASWVDQLIDRTQSYAWPGNVRELENLIERIAACAGSVELSESVDALAQLLPEVLSPASGAGAGAGAPVSALEQELINVVSTLASCGGDRELACKRLGIGRTTLWRKLKVARAKQL